jgi:hypothetical protein
MIQRIVTAAVLSAGVAVLFSPSFAQMTMPGQAPQGGTMTTSPSGSMSSGTMSGSQSGTITTTQGRAGVSSSQSSTMDTTAAPSGANLPRGAKAKAQSNINQAQARGGRGVEAAEQQITECLNNAAAQHQSLDSCKR